MPGGLPDAQAAEVALVAVPVDWMADAMVTRIDCGFAIRAYRVRLRSGGRVPARPRSRATAGPGP
jgi:hypothetical protein